MNCTTRGCLDEAVATVPGYPIPMPKCFRHEREYVDRYGHAGVQPILRQDESPRAPLGRSAAYRRRGHHTNGPGLADHQLMEYEGTGR